MNTYEILKQHEIWVESEGARGYCADFRGLELNGFDFSGLNLNHANFGSVNLIGAGFSRANLNGANFAWANLKGANLSGANLKDAYLGCSNLTGANIANACLKGACFYNCKGGGARIKTIDCAGIYIINYTSEDLQIGCKNYSFEEWKNFSNEEISAMDHRALDFWCEYKDFIFSTIEKNPAE